MPTGTLKDAILSAIDKIPSVYAGTMSDDMGIGDVVAKEDVKRAILEALEATDAKRDARLAKELRDAEDSTDYHNVGRGISCYDKEKVRAVIAKLEGTKEYQFDWEIVDALDATAAADKRKE